MSSTIYAPESFIIEPKKNNKKQSVSKLKERVCNSYIDCLSESAQLLTNMSTIQQKGIAYVQEYAEGNKIDATAEQLQQLADKLDTVTNHMHQIRREIDCIAAVIPTKK